MAVSEKFLEDFCETMYEELSSKEWSMGQHHIPPKHFHLKARSNC